MHFQDERSLLMRERHSRLGADRRLTEKVDGMLSFALWGCLLVLALGIGLRERVRSVGAEEGIPTVTALPDDAFARVVSNARPVVRTSTGPGHSVIVFADFQCPATRRFLSTVWRAMEESHASLDVRLLHFPLRSLVWSHGAAVAVECAAGQDRIAQYVTELSSLAHSDLTLEVLRDVATTAGADVSLFLDCMTDPRGAIAARIAADRAVGESIGVEGTPGVILNGWHHPYPPGGVEALLGALEEIHPPFLPDPFTAEPAGAS